MPEVEAVTIGVLGLALIITIWFLVNKKGVDENRIKSIAKLMAIEIVREAREELGRESDARAEQLARETERTAEEMTAEVEEVKTENITLKQLIDKVAEAQKATSDAVTDATDVSQRVVNALGGNDPHVKKEYGEGRAENILVMAGFVEGEHFLKQPALAPYKGNPSGKSPDFALLLAGGGATAIDCKAIVKAGFNAFYELDTEDDAAKKKVLLAQHAQNIWNTVKELAERNYPLGLEQQFGKGRDYTLMFIPNEEFYYRAEMGVSDDLRKSMGYNTLREAAIRRRVFFCSPENLAMRAVESMDERKALSALVEADDILELVQALAEAVAKSEDEKAAHHKKVEDLVESWNAYVKETESKNANRKSPSLRVAITNLWKKAQARDTFSSVRGKKGSRAEPIPLTEISISPVEPTKADVAEFQLSSRLTAEAVEEEE